MSDPETAATITVHTNEKLQPKSVMYTNQGSNIVPYIAYHTTLVTHSANPTNRKATNWAVFLRTDWITSGVS